MSDQDRILLIISIQYQADKGWGKRKTWMRAWLVDPLPNSQNKHSENNMAGSKENKWVTDTEFSS